MLLYALSACIHTLYDRASLAVPGAPRPPYPLSLHVAHQKYPFSSSSPTTPLSPQSNRNWYQTHSTSFPSRHLLIPHCHPLGAVRATIRPRQHRSWRTSLYPPSLPSRTMVRLSNGPAHVIAGRHVKNKHAQETNQARMNLCTCCRML